MFVNGRFKSIVIGQAQCISTSSANPMTLMKRPATVLYTRVHRAWHTADSPNAEVLTG